MDNKRNVKVDILRGIATLAVILGHSFIEYPIDISGIGWCNTIHYAVYSFHMPLFFILAGYCYSFRGYSKYIKGKLIRIALPYLFFGIFTVLLHRFGGALINGSEVSLKDGFIDLLFYGNEIWFLYVLFVIFAFYPLLNMALKNKYVKLTAIVALFAVASCDFNLTRILQIKSVVKFLPYFMLGNYLKEYPLVLRGKEKGVALVCACVLTASTVCVERLLGIENIVSRVKTLAICSILYLIVDFAYYCSKEKLGSGIIGRLIIKCSSYSLQFYLIQAYIIAVLRYVLCSVLKASNAIIIVTVIFAVTTVLCLIASEIIKRIPVISLLCGFKRKSNV